MIIRSALATVSLLSLMTAPAFAQDNAEMVQPVEPISTNPRLVFSVRGGLSVKAEYFGSEDYELGPDFNFRLNYLDFGGVRFGDPDPSARPRLFNIGPSFRYISERDSDDELEGLDSVDATIEVGLSVGYAQENFLAFAEVRRGFGGHEGWVGELGADFLYRANDDLLLSLGPRVLFGDDEFNDTYFGVTLPEASADLPEFDPDGGLVSAGLEFGMRYRINNQWGIEGAVTWDKFQNDASDSPIVDQGDDSQWSARIGLTYLFTLGR